MPSRRHSSAMLCSPRKPSSTTRIVSSAEYCFRVARRMSFTTCSDDTLVVSDFCLISASPWSYDEPEILPCSTRLICLTSADGGHLRSCRSILTPKVEHDARQQHSSTHSCAERVTWTRRHRMLQGEKALIILAFIRMAHR